MSDQYCETCSSLSGCICNILLGPGLTSVSTPSPSTPPPQSQPLSTNSAQTPGHFTPAYPVQHLFNTPPPSQNLYPPPGVFDSSHSQFYTPHHTWHTAQYGYNGILPPGDAYWYSDTLVVTEPLLSISFLGILAINQLDFLRISILRAAWHLLHSVMRLVQCSM